MPIVPDAAGWTEPRLRELLRLQAREVAETLERLRDPALPDAEPAGLRTAIDLLQNVEALAMAAERAGTPRAILAAVANVQYDAIVAGIDLLKSHSGLPSVPRRR
jgi:hypothetical protein